MKTIVVPYGIYLTTMLRQTAMVAARNASRNSTRNAKVTIMIP